jgi:hypothetical protein
MFERQDTVMSTFWLKIAGVLVVVVAIGAFVMWIRSGIEEAQHPEVTFYDMVEKDRKELLAEPNARDLTSQPAQPQTPTAAEPNKSAQSQTPTVAESNKSAQMSEPQLPKAEPVTFYFTQLDEIEQIEAERLLATIPTGRSIGRLPMTGYNLMVETCRQIMGRWPGSIYDYKARRALNQMPERFRQRYRITDQELDLTQFTKPRPNTTPYTIKEED